MAQLAGSECRPDTSERHGVYGSGEIGVRSDTAPAGLAFMVLTLYIWHWRIAQVETRRFAWLNARGYEPRKRPN